MDKSIDRQLSEFWNEIEISSSKNLTRLRWRTSEIVQRNYGKCAYVRKKSIMYLEFIKKVRNWNYPAMFNYYIIL